MVASPARILRLRRTAGFGPRLLAAIINETAPHWIGMADLGRPGNVQRRKPTASKRRFTGSDVTRAGAHRRIDAVHDLTRR